jgi:GDP-4-dehydro-6-deoxy-D-mannose reductase
MGGPRGHDADQRHRQAAQARISEASRLEISTGRAETRRELTDVRDVVRAYRLLAEPDVPLGVYNVCSGVSSATAERVAAVARAIAPIEVEHKSTRNSCAHTR